MRFSVHLKSVSPVSWGDADRKSDPLIVRIPSIRGTLRKWYRWYLASKEPQLDIRKEEAEVFGTVHDGARRSRVKLQFNLGASQRIFMDGRQPFLWPLRREGRTFYTVDFDLIVDGECKAVNEMAKALSLSLSLGGFGYRSNRGYGSFRIADFSRDISQECIDAFNILNLTREITNAPTASSWTESLSKLLKSLGIGKMSGPELRRIQNISNCYLISRGGYGSWKEALVDLEVRLKRVERSLRALHKGMKDYRVLLGSPVLDPFRRRAYFWKERRTSPLVMGVGNGYIRGALFISDDYPERVIDHFGDEQGLLDGFNRIRGAMEREGFEITWVGDLL